ncbi:MAG: hypothetical protein FWF03_01865 [Defluviitaleaceae bacterium]|nr:hypothetical protein [Defluviitaleaceae bacterium]
MGIETDIQFDNDGNQTDAERINDESFASCASDIVGQIKAIAADNAHIVEALRSIEKIESSVDGTGGQKASAIKRIVEAREATNMQMLRLLEKVYDDTKPTQPKSDSGIDAKMQYFDKICKSLSGFTDHMGGTSDEVLEIVSEMTKRIFP